KESIEKENPTQAAKQNDQFEMNFEETFAADERPSIKEVLKEIHEGNKSKEKSNMLDRLLNAFGNKGKEE
ncbi:hypothetical protein LJC55_03040, partial [Eubacteriales bacterium OttesenSCG-928-N14]|nr:hypothetical protein [Eubacteriales bacterium OttesenSCG-928-N14]